jgi:ribosome maturation factor RimP
VASTTHGRDEVEALLMPILEDAGLDLEGLTVRLTGSARRVSVLVDKDGGIGIDECAELSRTISAALDADVVMGEKPYTLEVGSPGATRPLTRARHYERAVGRLLRLTLTSGQVVTGRLVGTDATDVADRSEGTVEVEVDGRSSVISLADIRKARVELEFRRSTDPPVDAAADEAPDAADAASDTAGEVVEGG